MFVSRAVTTKHRDLIHDFAFDYYGRRLVTCSSDGTLKVWDSSKDGGWCCTSTFPVQNGPVWRVCWSYPEFGQLIAACSFEKTVIIWEEVFSGSTSSSFPFSSADCGDEVASGSRSHWVRRCKLVDSCGSVTDVRFCPRHLGLQLATCSTDRMLRIYEAEDVMNVSQWTLQQIARTSWNPSSRTWSQSRQHPPLMAVGYSSARQICHSSTRSCDEPQTKKSTFLEIFEYKEQERLWTSMECLSNEIHVLEPVFDVAFAPTMGKSYHTLAVAADQCVLLLYLYRNSSPATKLAESSISSPSTAVLSPGRYTVKRDLNPLSRSASEPNGTVPQSSRILRVNWNVTGTLLTSAGEDGLIRVWMRNAMDTWNVVACIQPDDPNLVEVSDGVAVGPDYQMNSSCEEVCVSGSARDCKIKCEGDGDNVQSTTETSRNR